MVPLQGAFAARRHLRAHVCARGNDKKKLDRRKKTVIAVGWGGRPMIVMRSLGSFLRMPGSPQPPRIQATRLYTYSASPLFGFVFLKKILIVF